MSLTTVLLRDEFSDTVAAGAVNGTLATDGVSTRTVVDTESKLSIGSNALSFSGGKTTPAWGDPGLWYPSISRVAGITLIVEEVQALTTKNSIVGFDTNQSGDLLGNGLYLLSGSAIRPYEGGVTGPIVSTYTSTSTKIAVVLRSAGAFYFKTENGQWILLWTSLARTDSPIYPAIFSNNSAYTSDHIRVAGYWLPVPIVSDGFSNNGTSDGGGHAETSGLGSGGSGIAWSGTTWSVSGGKAINTPILGSELVANGGFETWNSATDVAGWTEGVSGTSTINQESSTIHGGIYAARIDVDGSGSDVTLDQTISTTNNTWFRFSSWLRGSVNGKLLVISASSSSMPATVQSLSASYAQYVYSGRFSSTSSLVRFRRSGSNYSAYIDDVSVKPIALSDLLSLHTSTTPDVFEGIDITVVSGTQAGLALNWDNATTPTNGVIAYNDGTNAKLEKCVAGTWTTVVSAASTYSANARLVVSKIGTAYRLYYNNALVGSGTISDAGIVNNTLHGRFSTYEGNTLDNYTCYASGTGGEYDSVFDICVSAVSAMSGIGTMSADATITRNATLALAGSTVMSADLSVDSSLRLAAELALTGSTAMSATFVKNIELALTGSAVMSATVQTLKRAELALSGTSTMHIHNFTKNSSIRSPGYTATIYS